MNGYKLINVRIFHPASNKVKARCEYTYCNHNDCKLLKEKKCAYDITRFSIICCPHGKHRQEEGFTQRARNFHNWMHKKRNENKEFVDNVSFNVNKLSIAGDYVYLPYPHLHTYINSIPGIINDHFIPIDKFTPELIYEIYNFRPQALFGGEITKFQENIIPKFFQHLKETMPDLYNDTIKIYPEIIAKGNLFNYIGRTAYVHTLKHNVFIKSQYSSDPLFLFNGKSLICENYKPLFPPFGSNGYFEIKVTDTMTCKITDNEQVTESTIFID